MARVDFTIWCDGCGIEILGVPVLRGKHDFCCQSCLHGFLCECCLWDSLDDDDHRVDELITDTLMDMEFPYDVASGTSDEK